MKLYLALGIIALSFQVIVVSNRTYVAPSGRESEFPRTRVATWRSLLQKTQFLTVWSITKAIARVKSPNSALQRLLGHHEMRNEQPANRSISRIGARLL